MAVGSLPGPNDYLLAAQKRVCTGPHQSRPLEDPERVLEVIAATARGELPVAERVSDVQLGALLAAMTIRRTFGDETGWTSAETAAFARVHTADWWSAEARHLFEPAHALSLPAPADRFVTLLNAVLEGRHLSRAQTAEALAAIATGEVPPVLLAALLIGQRMNIETDDELLGYVDACLLGPPRALAVDRVLHLGEPYDGMTRYLRPTLFVAATLAAMGLPVLLHGVDTMAPKLGVTDEQLIAALGGPTNLDIQAAARLLEDGAIGFAYLNQRQFAPAVEALRDVRLHLGKRPVFATAEKAVVLFRARERTAVAAGYFHPSYERKLLTAMTAQHVDLAIAIKGLEGTTNLALRAGRSKADKPTFNLTHVHRRDIGATITLHVDPRELGFDYAENPRRKLSAADTARAGVAALSGQPGELHDAIALNAAWLVHLIDGAAPDDAVEHARTVIASGAARAHLQRFLASGTE